MRGAPGEDFRRGVENCISGIQIFAENSGEIFLKSCENSFSTLRSHVSEGDMGRRIDFPGGGHRRPVCFGRFFGFSDEKNII